MKKKILMIVGIIFIITGCTSIPGQRDRFTIHGMVYDHSNRPVGNYVIFVDGMEMCKTPCILPLERKSSSTYIVAKKEGYEDKQLLLRSGLNKIAIFNLTYIPSWLTDAVSGGMWQYNRDGVYIDMEKTDLKGAALEQSKRNTAVRRFALFNYQSLKLEAASNQTSGEYLTALSELSGINKSELMKTVNQTQGEVNLAHALVK